MDISPLMWNPVLIHQVIEGDIVMEAESLLATQLNAVTLRCVRCPLGKVAAGRLPLRRMFGIKHNHLVIRKHRVLMEFSD